MARNDRRERLEDGMEEILRQEASGQSVSLIGDAQAQTGPLMRCLEPYPV
jgi:hypothetical protein